MGMYVLAQTFKKSFKWSLMLLKASYVHLVPFCSFLWSLLYSSIQSNQVLIELRGLVPPSKFCPRVPLSSMKMSNVSELVMYVDPKELSLKLWEGKEASEKIGVGGRLFQVQMMTRKLLWGSSRGS